MNRTYHPVLFILFVILSFVNGLPATAQIHNTSAIFIPQSISVSASDINNAGFLQNNGNIYLSGNWLNTNVYQGNGEIVLNGSDQHFNNNQQPVHHFVIDGGGVKDLNRSMVITGSVNFAYGILKVHDTDTIIVRTQASVKGGSEFSYVDGALTIAGTGYRFFPVGCGGEYYPVALTDVRGLDPVIEIKANKDLPDITTEVPVELDKSVYWIRKTSDGIFAGSPVSAPSFSDHTDLSRLVFVESENLEGAFSLVPVGNSETKGNMTMISSKDVLTKAVFAVGELPEKPVLPSYLSTTLSPNASNPDNRVIRLFGSDLKSDNFYFQVYSRWGNQLYESRSLEDMAQQGWDGTHDGQILPAGAYPYTLVYKERTGKEKGQSGFITILH